MKKLTLLLLFMSLTAQARVLSPSSIEARFSFRSEFQTSQKGTAQELALRQARYLFGYMQNPEIGPSFGLDRRIGGIGAPRWEPKVRILSDQLNDGGVLRHLNVLVHRLGDCRFKRHGVSL